MEEEYEDNRASSTTNFKKNIRNMMKFVSAVD